MRTLLQALTELVEPRLLQNGPLKLREDDEGSRCPETLLQRSGKAVALRFGPWKIRDLPPLELPPNHWLFPLFRRDLDKPPLCRSCDYVIFYAPRDDDDRLFVFLCELKSGGARGAHQQLRNTKLLADYLLAVMNLHGRVERWPEIVFRGLIFADGAPTQKGTTRAPGGAEYIEDPQLPGLRTVIQRPGGSYDLAYFCV